MHQVWASGGTGKAADKGSLGGKLRCTRCRPVVMQQRQLIKVALVARASASGASGASGAGGAPGTSGAGGSRARKNDGTKRNRRSSRVAVISFNNRGGGGVWGEEK